MKIVQINSTCGAGSTGKICVSVSRLLSEKGVENYILYSHGTSDFPSGIKNGNRWYFKAQALFSRLLGAYGFVSYFSTRSMIRRLKEISPDVVHLHNIHGHDCNVEGLLAFLRKRNIKVYWTFHDCWTFTGYCPHFTLARCDRWRTECHHCPQRASYSWFFDRSRSLFKKKKKAIQGMDITVISPSQWLADIVKESFFKECDIRVINNGIDLQIFKPTESDFRARYGIPEDKKILLGVAFGWGIRKGLDVFVELSKQLDADRYQIVLVGTDDNVDAQLPKSIISIHRTQNQKELAEIYSVADLFVNPTREENYPTVNMESVACGTPVVTFATGGSPEMLDASCGAVVPCDDTAALKEKIVELCETKPLSREACLLKAKEYNMHDRFCEYVHLYEK